MVCVGLCGIERFNPFSSGKMASLIDGTCCVLLHLGFSLRVKVKEIWKRENCLSYVGVIGLNRCLLLI